MTWLVIDGVAHRVRPGSTTLGRSATCDIVLSDELASRNHATLVVGEHSAAVRDNRSRNGTIVNGEMVVGSKTLSHLDQVMIGSSRIVFHTSDPTMARPEQIISATPPTDFEADDPYDFDAGETQATNTATGTGHLVIGALVARALDGNDLETAGRMVQNLAQRMMLGARELNLKPQDLAACTDIIMRFASESHDPRWIEWVLDIHTVMVQVPSRFSVDTICSLGGEGQLSSPLAARRWLTAIGRIELSNEQRFLVSRIESLERLLSA